MESTFPENQLYHGTGAILISLIPSRFSPPRVSKARVQKVHRCKVWIEGIFSS